MWAAILAIIPAVVGWVGDIIGYFQASAAEQTAADAAEQTAEGQHSTDGIQSVTDLNSSNSQNAALDAVEQGLGKPVVITETKK